MAESPVRKTELQKLSELAEWFVLDRGIDLKFSYNPKHSGRMIPEYDLYYYEQGRRVTDRCIAMQMATEFRNRNYNSTIPQCHAALTAFAWKHYLATFTPPEWITEASAPKPEKKPVGRPRKHALITMPSVNTDDDDEQDTREWPSMIPDMTAQQTPSD